MMPELILLGYPLSTLFLYFCFYSCAGWCMETVYCSIMEKRFVPRGFLHGPLCPIYGVGVLLMILFFAPLQGNLVIFYVVSTVVMSAWEYFVGWFLEVTTHIKYWDYSMYRFNLKGRICLWVCLVWGLLSYVCIFWIHPPVAALFARIPLLTRQIVAIVLAVAVLADAIATIRELALMTKVLGKLETLSAELQRQVSLGKTELSDRLSSAKDKVTDKFQGAKDMVTDTFQDAKEAMVTLLPDSVTDAGSKLKARYNDLVASAERRTRRLRNIYHPYTPKLDERVRRDISDHGDQLTQERKNVRAAKRSSHQKKEK